MPTIKILLIYSYSESRQALITYLSNKQQIAVDVLDESAQITGIVTDSKEYDAIVIHHQSLAELGIDIVKDISRQYPKAPILSIVDKEPKLGIQALEDGAFTYFLSPLDFLELATTIHELTQKNLVFSQIVQHLQKLLEVDVCLAWQLDRKSGVFELVANSGQVSTLYYKTVKLSIEEENWKNHFLKGKPVIVSDITDPSLSSWFQHRQSAIDEGWSSLISIPLIYRQRLIGIVDCYTIEPRNFIDTPQWKSLEQILRFFADRAAETIRQADLTHRIEAVQKIYEAISYTQDEKTIIRQVLQQSLRLVGTETGWIYLLNNNENVLELYDSLGIPDELMSHQKIRQKSEGVTGWVATHGRAIEANELTPCHIPLPGLPVRSEIGVPLKQGQRTIGVLVAKSLFSDHFTKDDIEILRALASQASITIERARLGRHLQKASQLAVNSDFQTLANYTVSALRDLTGADVIMRQVFRKQDNTPILDIVAYQGDVGETFQSSAILPIDPSTSINAFALSERKPVIRKDIPNDVEFPQFFYMSEALKQGWHSMLCVPLFEQANEYYASSSQIGTLSLYSREIGLFTNNDIELVQTFANQLAIAFQQHERKHALGALHQTSLDIITHTDSDKLMTSLIDRAARLFGGDTDKKIGVGFWKCNYDANEASLAYSTNKKWQGMTIKLTESLIRRVIETGSAQYINDFPNWNGRASIFDKTNRIGGIKNLIEAPIKKNGIVTAILAITDASGQRRFNDADIVLLESLADMVAIAIQNAQFIKQEQILKHQAESLWELARKISSQPTFKSLPRVIELATELSNADFVEIYVLDPETGVIEAKYQWPLNTQASIPKRITEKTGLALEVYRRHDIVRSHSNSSIGFPLRIDANLIGILIVGCNQTYEFSEDEIRLFTTLVEQSALTIEKERLFRVLKRQREDQIRAIHEITKSIAGQHGELKFIFRQMLSWLVILIKGTISGAIYLFDENTNKLILEEYIGKPIPEKLHQISPTEGTIGKVSLSGKSIILDNVLKVNDYVEGFPETRSELVVPIIKKGKVIGVLNLEHPHIKAFKEHDKVLVESIAELAVVAGTSQELVSELTKKASSLEKIQSFTSSVLAKRPKMKNILDTIIMFANDVFQGADCAIRIYNTQASNFGQRVTATASLMAEDAMESPRIDGVSWHIVNTRKPYYVGDAFAESDKRPQLRDIWIEKEIRTIAALPLIRNGEAIGVIYLISKKPNLFPENDHQIIELFADQVAIVIHNAQLNDQIEKTRDAEIEIISNIANNVSMNAHEGRDKLLKSIINSIGALMGRFNLYDVRLVSPIDQDKLVIAAIQGKRAKGFQHVIKIGEGIIGWVAEHKKSQIIADVTKDPRYLPGLENARSELVVPMLKGNHLVGVLNIEHHDINVFNESDEKLAQAIANLAVIAIENTELYANMRQNVAFELNHKISNELGWIPNLISFIIDGLHSEKMSHSDLIDYLDRIKNQINHIKQDAQQYRFINDVTEISIIAILDEVFSRITNSVLEGKQIQIVRNYADGIPSIKANESKIYNSIFNVIKNSIEAMSTGGVLTIQVSIIEKPHSIKIVISDNGVGIHSNNLEKIFSRGFTTKPQGIGFGLFESREYINKIGGKIEVSSKLGNGTQFKIYIPCPL